ncbi:BBP7 family outer membrane beta-barrel protein, partial [Pirellulales bacterium]|nr:BBP7 family outer membrane beta-barrel protein [Pirellulales bacterium]
ETLVPPVPNAFGDLPSLEIPTGDAPGIDVGSIPDPAATSGNAPEIVQTPGRDDDEGVRTFVPGETVRMLELQPAITESSGSWLRRGFWYAEVDAVIFNRIWSPDGLILAEENTDTRTGAAGFPQNIPIANQMFIDDSDPGAEGLPRITLGKFLFRDEDNRDHVAELTWFGGGQWTQRANLQSITSDPNSGGLQVPSIIDRSNPSNTLPGNPSFDGATSMDFRYDSHMDSVEVNYAVRQRMHRDRMILKPDGRWVREATPSRTVGFIAGVRYMNLREALRWDADGIPDANSDGLRESGRYFVATDNNLIGTQLGFSAARESARWSLGFEGKIGGYWNAMDLNSALDITGGAAAARSNASDDNLSLVLEASLTGKWHLTPRWSIRTGLELLWVEGLALAPNQLNFIPGGYDVVVDTGNNVFMGTSLGVESYW